VSYLLDIDVISELRKPAGRASMNVCVWAGRQRASDLLTSVITLMEICLLRSPPESCQWTWPSFDPRARCTPRIHDLNETSRKRRPRSISVSSSSPQHR